MECASLGLGVQQSDEPHRCSFCGKRKAEVETLISGGSVFICDECVSLCNEILAEAKARAEATRR